MDATISRRERLKMDNPAYVPRNEMRCDPIQNHLKRAIDANKPGAKWR